MTKNLLTSHEAAELVSQAIGERIGARRVNYWARNRSGGFPPLALDLNPGLMRHDRAQIEAWLRERFPNDSQHTKRAPAARLERVIRRGRPRA